MFAVSFKLDHSTQTILALLHFVSKIVYLPFSRCITFLKDEKVERVIASPNKVAPVSSKEPFSFQRILCCFKEQNLSACSAKDNTFNKCDLLYNNALTLKEKERRQTQNHKTEQKKHNNKKHND